MMLVLLFPGFHDSLSCLNLALQARFFLCLDFRPHPGMNLLRRAAYARATPTPANLLAPLHINLELCKTVQELNLWPGKLSQVAVGELVAL